MKLPPKGRSNELFRRESWGKVGSVAYYDNNISSWRYKNAEVSQASSDLSYANLKANDWERISSNKTVLKDDIVELAWISSSDPIYSRRHELLHKAYKVLNIKEVAHPSIPPYKGSDPWYNVVLQTRVGKLENISLELCQLKRIFEEIKEVDDETPMVKIEISYGNVSAIQQKINEITNQSGPKPIYSIKDAKKGDIVEFLGRGDHESKEDDSFIRGEFYKLRRDYDAGGYNNSKTPEGKLLRGTISVVKDSRGRENGWAAAFFRLERKTHETIGQEHLFI